MFCFLKLTLGADELIGYLLTVRRFSDSTCGYPEYLTLNITGVGKHCPHLLFIFSSLCYYYILIQNVTSYEFRAESVGEIPQFGPIEQSGGCLYRLNVWKLIPMYIHIHISEAHAVCNTVEPL